MKTLLFFCLIISASNAQVIVDDVDINSKPDVKFIEVVSWKKPLSSKVQIIISYGQNMSFFDGPQFVKDEAGKRVDFNSPIDALNFLTKNGWDYIDNYSFNESGMGNVVHFLLKRKEE